VRMAGGQIAAVDLLPAARPDELPWIGPGLVDMQINGHGGISFTGPEATAEGLRQVTRALWPEGVTAFCPTVVTSSDDDLGSAMRAIARACDDDPAVARAVPCIHLEGPFLSPHDGPRGAHDRAHIRPPDWALFERWQDAASGRIGLVTVSPEWPEAPAFVARCVERGIVVSIGHTAASAEQLQAAIAAGASMSTHLGNGSHLMLPRHHNYIWEQLADDRLWASLIADGFHLPLAVLTVMLRAKGSRALLVSDAVSLSGLPPGEYGGQIGNRVVLTPEGRLHLADNPGLLAGSAQLLLWDIEHLVRTGLAAPGLAWEMASLRPALCLDLPAKAGLATGAPADLVTFTWQGDRVRVVSTYNAGVAVYRRS
jgi:N-acetylglucosamine-6-phosphate deacetylase